VAVETGSRAEGVVNAPSGGPGGGRCPPHRGGVRVLSAVYCSVTRHNGEMNVVSFVLARIAEDERVALSSMHRSAGSTRGLSTRGLRETAFKRRLVDDALRGVSWNFAQGEDGDVHAKQPVLGRLAMVYADHPDFDARWAS
jgi:uncharacterized protein DUF6221